MSVKEFNKLFGIREDIDGEKNKFIQRVNLTIFSGLEKGLFGGSYETLFKSVCYELGINSTDIIRGSNRYNYGGSANIPGLRHLTGDDFIETLKILVILYEIINPVHKLRLNHAIEVTLAASSVDLAVRWKDGLFYPSGAKELDEKLINDNLEWLNKFPDVKQFFSTALSHFANSLPNVSARKDAITNAYTALENIAQIVLGNKKTFEKNSDELVTLLELPTEYKNVVFYYKQIAHGYSSRHAGSDIPYLETEAFVYLTGILLRLISQKKA